MKVQTKERLTMSLTTIILTTFPLLTSAVVPLAAWVTVGGFVEDLGSGDAVESLVGESGMIAGGVRGSGENADLGRLGWDWTAVDIVRRWVGGGGDGRWRGGGRVIW